VPGTTMREPKIETAVCVSETMFRCRSTTPMWVVQSAAGGLSAKCRARGRPRRGTRRGDIAPDLAGATVELTRHSEGETYLRQALASDIDRYSFVFLDCPPSFGPLTVNALAAADRVLIPVQAEYYALEGLSQLVQSINLVKARLNPRLAVGGVLLTMVDGRTRLSADVEAEVRKHFGELVFTQTVPRSVRLAEAPSHGLPAIAYDRRSRGADAYWKVAMELVDRA